MPERLLQILDTLFMIDDKPSSIRRWRTMMALITLGFALHIAWACGWLPPLEGFALASDLRDGTTSVKSQISRLDERVSKLETTVLKGQYQAQRTQLEVELRRLEQAIFDIEAKIAQLNKENIRIDTFYVERLKDLKGERDDVSRRLDNFIRLHPESLE